MKTKQSDQLKQKTLPNRNKNLHLQEGLSSSPNVGEEINNKSPLWIISKIEIKYKDQTIDSTFSLPITKELETEEDFDEYGWSLSQHIKLTLQEKLNKNK